MIEGKPSQTAFMTAIQRGHHFHKAKEPKVLRDSLALSLAGIESIEVATSFLENIISNFAALSDPETAATFMEHIESTVCMRSRVVEEELAVARRRGLKQLVILGAGLDSTAYRCTELIEGLQIFEVDHPSTQSWKRERVKSAGINVPDNLTYVAFDFENQTLKEALKQGGVQPDAMTLFTWLGVQMYLTDEAVKSTLNVLGAYPSGSEIVMDFISPSYVVDGNIPEDSVTQLQKIVTDMGEPIKSRYYENELEDILKQAGFTEVNYLSAKWFVENYLGGERGSFNVPDTATSILTAVI